MRDRVAGVVTGRAGRGARRQHLVGQRIAGAGRHHRTEHGLIALIRVVDVAGIAVDAHARPRHFRRVVLHTGGKRRAGRYHGAGAGIDAAAEQHPGLAEQTVDVVAVRERRGALRVAVDAVDHALEVIGFAQLQAIGHHGRRRAQCVVADVAGLDRVAGAAVKCLGQRVRARRGAECAVADVALVVGHHLSARAERARQRHVGIRVLHDHVDQRARRDLGARLERLGLEPGLLDLADADDPRRALGERSGGVGRDGNRDRVAVAAVVDALVGKGVGAAAAVVIRGELGGVRGLADQVAVGHVEPQVAEACGAAARHRGTAAGAIGGHQVVARVAVLRIRQVIGDRDKALVGVVRHAVDVHLVAGGVFLVLVPVHGIGRQPDTGAVAARAVLVGDVRRLARWPEQRLRERQMRRVERRGRFARMAGQA